MPTDGIATGGSALADARPGAPAPVARCSASTVIDPSPSVEGMSDLSDRELVAAAARGDQAAFRALYDRHVRAVFWRVQAGIRNPSDAEELTQEVFIVAWNKIRSIDLVGESLLPWLLSTGWNLTRNRLRAPHHRSAPIELTEELIARQALPAPSLEQSVATRSLLQRIEHEVGGMADADQQIFRLCLYEGLSYAEAAERHGLTHASVRKRLERIRARLRKGFGGER